MITLGRRASRRVGLLVIAACAVACGAPSADPSSDRMVVVTSTSTLAPTETEEAAVTTDTDSIEGDDVVEQSPAVVSSGDQGPDEPELVNSTTTEPELDESSTDAVTDLTVADLTLSSDRIGPFPFGTPIVRVLDGLVVALGPAMSDVVALYTPGDAGRLVDGDGFAFDHPFGRQTCFGNGLCVEAGAADTADLRLVGWSLTEGDGEPIPTNIGLRLGDALGDSSDVVIDPFGCSVIGTGRLGGLELELLSTDGPFPSGADDDATSTPPSTALVVVGLSAGSLRTATFASC